MEELKTEVQNFTKQTHESAWETAPPPIPKQRKAADYIVPKYSRGNSRKKKTSYNLANIITPTEQKKLQRSSTLIERITNKIKNDLFQQYLESLTPASDTEYSIWRVTFHRLKQPRSKKTSW